MIDKVNKEWHGVEIEGGEIPPKVREWLDTEVGTEHWFRKGTWGGQTIYFDNEKTHFLFLMKWGL